MRAPFGRFLLAFSVAAILVCSLAAIASAHVVSKTINVTNGECSVSGDPPQTTGGQDCGAAVYDPVLGFTGSITFEAGEGAVLLADFLCENIGGNPGAFTSVGANYTMTFYADGDLGGAPLGTWAYSFPDGVTCNDGNKATVYPIDFTVGGASGDPDIVVEYSLTLSPDQDYSGDNSILNRIEEFGDGHANSPSVAPPQGPPDVPEAPLTVLLVLTGGLGAAWFISRRMRPSLPMPAN
jgi:hypothetical protein